MNTYNHFSYFLTICFVLTKTHSQSLFVWDSVDASVPLVSFRLSPGIFAALIKRDKGWVTYCPHDSGVLLRYSTVGGWCSLRKGTERKYSSTGTQHGSSPFCLMATWKSLTFIYPPTRRNGTTNPWEGKKKKKKQTRRISKMKKSKDGTSIL